MTPDSANSPVMPGLGLIGCHVQRDSLGSGVGGQEVWGFLSTLSLLPALYSCLSIFFSFASLPPTKMSAKEDFALQAEIL